MSTLISAERMEQIRARAADPLNTCEDARDGLVQLGDDVRRLLVTLEGVAEAERGRIATLLRARADFSSGALAEALEDVARGVLEGETDPDRALREPPPEEVQRRATERRVRAAGIKATVRQWCRDNLDDPEVLAEVRNFWGKPITDPTHARLEVSAGHAYNVFRRRFPAVHEVLGDIAADEWTIDDVSVADIEAAIRGAK